MNSTAGARIRLSPLNLHHTGAWAPGEKHVRTDVVSHQIVFDESRDAEPGFQDSLRNFGRPRACRPGISACPGRSGAIMVA